MSKEIICNDVQRLFVIPNGSGYSTYGYDNCHREAKAIAEKLSMRTGALSPEDRARLPDLVPNETEIGTLRQYEQHRALVSILSSSMIDLGTWFTPGTPSEVERILDNARRAGTRLRITYGDRETGQPWDDRPSLGRIGRSMGPLKVPLLIHNSRSHGGAAILTDCIVSIETSVGRENLYRHPGPVAAETPIAPSR